MDKSIIAQKLSQQGFDGPIAEMLIRDGVFQTAKSGDIVVDIGNKKSEIPIVLDGLLKVSRPDKNGHELFLYYLESGDPCTLSITCCLEHPNNTIRIYAETDVELFMIPHSTIDECVARFHAFRRFIFSAYGQRMEEMLQMIDSLAFMRMDERLFNYLLNVKQSSGDYSIHKTHQQIANELNSSRVVVSRLLKKMEQEGKIEIYRNRIDIL